MRWRDGLAGLFGGHLWWHLAIPRGIVCIALLGVPHICWSLVKLPAKSHPVWARDVLIGDISIERRVFASVQKARHFIERQNDWIAVGTCWNFVRYFIVGNKVTASKNHRGARFVTKTRFFPRLNELDADGRLNVRRWRFSNIHKTNGEGDWAFRGKASRTRRCPGDDPRSL